MAFDVLIETVEAKGEGQDWGGRAVRTKAWHEAMKRSGRFGDPQSATFRSAWLRAQEKLGEGGHIEFRGEYVWPSNQAALFARPPF
jgi:hypothetical protein